MAEQSTGQCRRQEINGGQEIPLWVGHTSSDPTPGGGPCGPQQADCHLLWPVRACCRHWEVGTAFPTPSLLQCPWKHPLTCASPHRALVTRTSLPLVCPALGWSGPAAVASPWGHSILPTLLRVGHTPTGASWVSPDSDQGFAESQFPDQGLNPGHSDESPGP